jgi:hypothetical protein
MTFEKKSQTGYPAQICPTFGLKKAIRAFTGSPRAPAVYLGRGPCPETPPGGAGRAGAGGGVWEPGEGPIFGVPKTGLAGSARPRGAHWAPLPVERGSPGRARGTPVSWRGPDLGREMLWCFGVVFKSLCVAPLPALGRVAVTISLLCPS